MIGGIVDPADDMPAQRPALYGALIFRKPPWPRQSMAATV